VAELPASGTIFPTLNEEIEGTYVGPSETKGFHTYNFRNTETGKVETFEHPYKLEKFSGYLNPSQSSNSREARELQDLLSSTFLKLMDVDQRGVWDRVIAPNFRAVPPNLTGIVPDLATIAAYVPFKYLASPLLQPLVEAHEVLRPGHEAELRGRFQKGLEPFGVEAQRRRFEGWARQADKYALENWSWSPFEYIGTDMTPEERGYLEEMLSGALEFGLSGAAEVKLGLWTAKGAQGVARIFMRLAEKSIDDLGEAATKPANIKSLIDRANAAYTLTTVEGAKLVAGDITFGVGAATFQVNALKALNAADPEAHDWLKGLLGTTAALAGPIAARSAVTGFFAIPGISKLTHGVLDPIFAPFASAARFEQREIFGGSPAGRRSILSVGEILRQAIKSGRGVDEASGLVFTTPELARSEANVLRARHKNIQDRLSVLSDHAKQSNPEAVARIERHLAKLLKDSDDLHVYGAFQERVLSSASMDPSQGSSSTFLRAEALRLVERREQFFNFIENRFKRAFDDFDFGGDKGGTKVDHARDYESVSKTGSRPVYEDTRRRLVMEADAAGIEGVELQFLTPQLRQDVTLEFDKLDTEMRGMLDGARASADRRIDHWRTKVDDYLAERGLRSDSELGDTERAYVGQVIRDSYDDVLREHKAFEGAAYDGVRGLNDKVTDNIVFPENSIDFATKEPIGGLTPEEYAARKLETLSRSDKFNLQDVPPVIAQLAGSRSVAAAIARMQKRAGEAASGEIKIGALERLVEDANSRRSELQSRLDTLASEERVRAKDDVLDLQSFLEDVEKQRPTDANAINRFANNRDIPWETMTAQEARSRAPKGLANIFNTIRRKKQRILELTGEGSRISPAARPIYDEILALTKKSDDYSRQLNDLTSKYFGEGMPVQPTGRLTSRNAAGDLVEDGVSAEDLRNTVADVGREMRLENARNGNTPRHAALAQARNTLNQLLSPQTFPNLNATDLRFASEVSELRFRIEGAQGDVLAKNRAAEVKVEQEVIPEAVLPAKAGREGDVALRRLRTAVSEVPDFVTITRTQDPKTGRTTTTAAIDEIALTPRGSLFQRPDVPFERVPIGREGAFEIRLKSKAPPTNRSLDLAENILLERLALTFPGGIDPRALDAFRQDHRAVLDFLENNGRSTVPKLMNDAEGLAEQVNVLNALLGDKTRRKLEELVQGGQIDLQGTSPGLFIDTYMKYIGNRRRNIGNNEALANALKVEPGLFVDKLINRVLSSDHPKGDLQEVLSVLKGNKTAEDGFKASFIANLFARSTSTSPGLQVELGKTAASVFDPGKFRELLANKRFRGMITEIFPDNPGLLDGLDKMGTVAFETGAYTKGTGTTGAARINVEDALNMEVWGNLGRILGLGTASQVGFINSLVAAGAGARYLRSVGKNITGNLIKDIVIDAALIPQRAVEMAERTGRHLDTFREIFARGLIDIVNVPRTIRRHPGPALEILSDPADGDYSEEDIQASLREPTGARPRLVASYVPSRAPVPESVLSRVSPVGQQPMPVGPRPTGPVSQETLAGLSQVGLPLFHAAHGGYVNGGESRSEESGIMSIGCKPRQIVG
jgi:hypothetical protein